MLAIRGIMNVHGMQCVYPLPGVSCVEVPTKLELASLVSQMDPNGTGTVDFPSFSVAITNFLKPQYDRAMLDKAFYEISG